MISLGYSKNFRKKLASRETQRFIPSELKRIQSNHIRIHVSRLYFFAVLANSVSKLMFLSRERFFKLFEESD